MVGLGLLAVVAAVIVNIATGVQKVRNQSMNANAQRIWLHTDIQYTINYNNYLPRLRNSGFVAGQIKAMV